MTNHSKIKRKLPNKKLLNNSVLMKMLNKLQSNNSNSKQQAASRGKISR
ncbi:hypothetical protein ACN08S_04185 [Photobacterium leiognathi subsp. mandapamensis]